MSNPTRITYQLPGASEKTRFEKIHNVSFTSPLKASLFVAKEIADTIKNANKTCVLGLATGSSPIEVYRELVRLHKNEGLSFKHVVSFNLDEYLGIAPSHLNSYYHYMHQHLFNHIDIEKKHIFIPAGLLKTKAKFPSTSYTGIIGIIL